MTDLLFSIIVTINNRNQYLDEAIESLMAQTFPFEKVQLILVDYGSADDSSSLCDRWHEKYPDNIIALYKESGNQASARNLGLEYAAGRYINFLDPDDKLSPEALQTVWDFFADHETETDLVAVPIICLAPCTGQPCLNEQSKHSKRVIDLTMEPRRQLASVSSAFFVGKAIKDIKFDTKLYTNEDLKFILNLISVKQTIGAVDGCSYLYRKRNDSAGMMDCRWYIDYFDHFAFGAVDRFKKLFGEVPPWAQYALLCDFFRLIKDDHSQEMRQILRNSEIREYYENIRKYVREFDDRMILSIPFFSGEQRWWMLKLKHPDAELQPVWQYDRVMLQYRGIDIIPADDQYTEISSVEICNSRIRVRGFCHVLPGGDPKDLKIALVIKEEWQFCKTESAVPKYIRRFGEPATKAIGFCGEIAMPEREVFEIKVGMEYPGELRLTKKTLHPGPNLPYGGLSHETVLIGGYKYFLCGGMICFCTCRTLKERIKRELAWDFTLLRAKAFGSLLCRWIGLALGSLKRKPVWLIADRHDQAGDNGEAFFDYLRMKKKKEVSPFFVISENSKDWLRLRKTGRAVKAQGLKHKLLSIVSDVTVSSGGRSPILDDPFGPDRIWNRDILLSKPFVFLQHGITLHDLSEDMCFWLRGYSGFVTAAERERNSILNNTYGYDDNEVWLTGFARYDKLSNEKKKTITIMPTWRKGLTAGLDKQTGKWILKDGFRESSYCHFYHCLLTDPKLIAVAERLNYTIYFHPHPIMAPYIGLFAPDDSIRITDGKTSYRDIFAKSALIVTDYSSVAFDFAYLEKPVIYTQFDREEVFSGMHTFKKGYFDYEKDGFGPVTTVIDETVDRIIEYMETGCRMEDIYSGRAKGFFAFHDKENCRRIYEKISEMMGTQ